MIAYANTFRRLLIRFGKVCPFVLCFLVFLSDVENIIAVSTQDIIFCGGVPIYNTPISFAIGSVLEIDFLILFIITVISLAIEACIYNITANIFLFIMHLRNHYLLTHEALSDEIYITLLSISAFFSSYFVYKGIKILMSK